MNQRIAVRALIKNDGKILLLRRVDGRQSILGKYELPGGRVEDGEQPEEALARHLKDSTDLTSQVIQLTDALTYTDQDDRHIQYAVILYNVSLVPGEAAIQLGSKYDRYVWKTVSSIQHDHLTDLTHLLLSVQYEQSPTLMPTISDAVEDNTTDGKVIIYCDGGSRGNPGPSAAGYVILDTQDNVISEDGAYIGVTTNNQAEYHGVHLGLEKAKEIGAKAIEFRLDSLLVVNQLNGSYVIRNRELWPIHERIRALVAQFDKVTFRHVKREFNQRADAMVNKILDEHGKEEL